MWKISKKRGKRLPFQAKQLSNDDMVNDDKSENSSFHDENDVIMEEDIHSQFFALDDQTKDYFILSKLCSKKKHFKYAAKNSE